MSNVCMHASDTLTLIKMYNHNAPINEYILKKEWILPVSQTEVPKNTEYIFYLEADLKISSNITLWHSIKIHERSQFIRNNL